ncbi:hypothetical protein BCR35DRAFT_304853 [Leucosporidium creatinivorum]|uniref:Uncharacterized protein n=1 Tax=Leucosporidium creatinivorum TaxID=106004 RepID=A0A1Y2F4N6_9BASI|nr:hypothetical protein BCR35DRAFT_304853 [Leucosporidium creatinivorum]
MGLGVRDELWEGEGLSEGEGEGEEKGKRVTSRITSRLRTCLRRTCLRGSGGAVCGRGKRAIIIIILAESGGLEHIPILGLDLVEVLVVFIGLLELVLVDSLDLGELCLQRVLVFGFDLVEVGVVLGSIGRSDDDSGEGGDDGKGSGAGEHPEDLGTTRTWRGGGRGDC